LNIRHGLFNLPFQYLKPFLKSFSEHRSIVKEKYTNLENRNITKILGEWWTSLGPEEKNAFNNLAADLKVKG
jgi:hypothetical protein